MNPAHKNLRTIPVPALAILLVLAVSGPSRLAAAGGLPTVTLVRADAPPAVDGKLDDAIWATAFKFENWKTFRPEVDKDPSQNTFQEMRRGFFFKVSYLWRI